MPKVHRRVAMKDYPNDGIKKGDTYYKWSLRASFRGKGITYRSKMPPRQSQLKSSEFLRTAYQIIEAFEDLKLDQYPTMDEFQSDIENLKDEIESLKDETQERLDNMPEGLQQGSTGQLLQERVEQLEDWISTIDGLSYDPPEGDQSLQERLQKLNEEVTSAFPF